MQAQCGLVYFLQAEETVKAMSIYDEETRCD